MISHIISDASSSPGCSGRSVPWTSYSRRRWPRTSCSAGGLLRPVFGTRQPEALRMPVAGTMMPARCDPGCRSGPRNGRNPEAPPSTRRLAGARNSAGRIPGRGLPCIPGLPSAGPRVSCACKRGGAQGPRGPVSCPGTSLAARLSSNGWRCTVPATKRSADST